MQNQVYIEQALGKAGLISRQNPVTKLPMVAEADVVAGGFCFAGTDPEQQVVGLKTGATAVAGFVVFEKYQPALSGAADSMAINDGEEVCVVKKGYCYAVSTTAAVKGQNVVVNPTTGAIQTLVITRTESVSGSAIEVTDNIPEGFIDTGWVVETGAAADRVCEICNI